MSGPEFLWGWQGRLNRRQALLGFLALGVFSTIGMFVLLPLVGETSGGGYLVSGADLFVVRLPGLLLLPFQASMIARRVHDHGRSAWLLAALAAVMIGGSWVFDLTGLRDTAFEMVAALPISLVSFWLLLAPGDTAANAYGPPPSPTWWP